MGADRVEAITAVLVETAEAHGRYEETELGGVYDRDWAPWYATHAVDHGLAAALGHAVTADELGRFLASTFVEFEQADPEPTEAWPAWTARRIAAEL